MTELELVDDIIKIADVDLKCADISTSSSKQSVDLAGSKHATTSSADSACSMELTSSALCRGEVCHWRHGDYALAGDPCDPGLGKFALEANIAFNSEGELKQQLVREPPDI